MEPTIIICSNFAVGMRILTHIMLLFVLLGALLGGSCRRGPGVTESRLIALDSLIGTSPDSALALLQAVDTAALSAADRAYLDLLTSQATKKTYNPITDSTAICRAWRYYKDHGPADRRIRALRYRAAAAEDLGDLEEAMRWYKRCELAARDEGDDYNTGYALMSMGDLYLTNFVTERAKQRFKQALLPLSLTNPESYQYTLLLLSKINAESAPDTAYHYLNLLRQSCQRCPGTYNDYVHQLAVTILFYQKQYQSVVDSLSQVPASARSFSMWNYGCVAFCKLEHLDSAEACLRSSPPPITQTDSMVFLHSMAEVMRLKGDYRQADKYETMCSDLTGERIVNSLSRQLIAAEEDVIKETEFRRHNISRVWITTASCVIIACLLAYAGWLVFTRLVLKRRQTEVEHDNTALKQTIAELSTVRDQLVEAIDSLANDLNIKHDEAEHLKQQLTRSRQLMAQTNAQIIDQKKHLEALNQIQGKQQQELDEAQAVRQRISELEDENTELEQLCASLQQSVEQVQDSSAQKEQEYIEHINKLNALLAQTSEGVELTDAWRPLFAELRKNINKVSGVKLLDSVIKVTLSEQYFQQIRRLVNVRHHGLVTRLTDSHKLTIREINIICLHLCGMPNTVIAVYAERKTHSIPKVKARIAEKYFGEKCSFDDFRKV